MLGRTQIVNLKWGDLMVGLDAGFFVEILEGHKKAIQVWRELFEGEEEAVCSILSLFELERGKPARLVVALDDVAKVPWELAGDDYVASGKR